MTALVNTVVDNIRLLMTQDEVNLVIEAIKSQMTYLSRKNIRQFAEGDKGVGIRAAADRDARGKLGVA